MHQHLDQHPPDRFPTDPAGLPQAGRPELLKLGRGDTLELLAVTLGTQEHAAMDHGAMGHGGADGIEWEDDMVAVNHLTTTATMHWRFLDRTTGTDNPAIDWQFRVGQRVKLRLVNELDSDHPMLHPFHLHGAGRFLVLSRDGVVEPNLVWKDTVLVRTGQTVDSLFDVSNPGLWMAHCHIAEHMQSGMMFSFNVAREREVAG